MIGMILVLLSFSRKNKLGTLLICFLDACSIADGEVSIIEDELSKSLLENNKCYLLDCGSEVFVWVGRITQVEERKTAIQVAEVIELQFSSQDSSVPLNPDLNVSVLHYLYLSRNLLLIKIGQDRHI